MSNKWVRYGISVVAIILLQVLILAKFVPGWSVHIMVYPMLIIALPFNTKPIWLMLAGFLIGISVDAFTDTFGLHASAAVLVAYLRPELMKIISPREGYDMLLSPNVKDMGFRWYTLILLIALSVHHLWFFAFESFNLYDFGFILLKTVVSVVASILVALTIQFVFYKPSKTNL